MANYTAGNNGIYQPEGQRFGKLTDPDYTALAGIKTTPGVWLETIPLASTVNNIALAQRPTEAGYLTLTAGTNVTSSTFQGLSVFTCDDVFNIDGINRASRFVRVVGASGATAQTITIDGFDAYDKKVTCSFLSPVGALTTYSPKAFKRIYRVGISGNPGANISVGFADIIGLPYVLQKNQYALVGWGVTNIGPAAFIVGDTTNPATATTTDVRGGIFLSTVATGTTQLGIQMVIGECLKPFDEQTEEGIIGVPQYSDF